MSKEGDGLPDYGRLAIRIPYLAKRCLAIVIDIVFLYGCGGVVYFVVKDKISRDHLELFLTLSMFFIVVSQETFYAYINYSLGQNIMGLRMEHYRLRKFKLIVALIRAFFISLVVVPFLEPLVQVLLAFIFLLSSVGTYKNNKMLFIDVLTGISVVEAK